MSEFRVAATQMACGWGRADDIARGEAPAHEAAAKGAQIGLLQRLFEAPCFDGADAST